MNTKEVRVLIEKIKSTASNEKRFFPWEDVYASMKKEPEKVAVTRVACPDCGKSLVKLYFSSPDWTWRQLCGRAGAMLVCPSCGTQEDFTLEIMN